MKFDITIFPGDLAADTEIARRTEEMGFDGFWTAEADHNPFLPLTLAASETTRINLGTQIAVAFPRSPMVTAQLAWDLAAQSKGRFILGLGTQVRAHIIRRFSTDWVSPIPRMKEYVECLRAIWHSFQTEKRPRHKGEHYTVLLMTPFFNPGPIEHPDIPVYVAGVNPKICHMAGEVCDGLHAHAFHTPRYMKEVVLHNIQNGLESSGRKREDFELVLPVFTVTGHNDEEMERATNEAKSHIAFYASTPAYQGVMDLHGWTDTREKLSQMARANQWDQMWKEISDEMLNEIAVVAPADNIVNKIKSRYTGIADRICLSWASSNKSGNSSEIIASIAEALKNS